MEQVAGGNRRVLFSFPPLRRRRRRRLVVLLKSASIFQNFPGILQTPMGSLASTLYPAA